MIARKSTSLLITSTPTLLPLAAVGLQIAARGNGTNVIFINIRGKVENDRALTRMIGVGSRQEHARV